MKHEKLRNKYKISDSHNTMEELSDAVFNEVNYSPDSKKWYPDGLIRFCDLHILLEILDRHDISLTSILNKNKHELHFEYSNESSSNSTFMITFQSSNGHLGDTRRWADKVLMEKINSDWEVERTYDYKKNTSSKNNLTNKKTLTKEYLQLADKLDVMEIGGQYQKTKRKEQEVLRKLLFHNKLTDNCAICDKEINIELLVCAHIKKHSKCSDEEKRNFHNVVPMCKFGCDELFEHGYITVHEGKIQVLKDNKTKYVTQYLNKFNDKACGIYNENNSKFFKFHSESHSR